jgi:hypothetical protein
MPRTREQSVIYMRKYRKEHRERMLAQQRKYQATYEAKFQNHLRFLELEVERLTQCLNKVLNL